MTDKFFVHAGNVQYTVPSWAASDYNHVMHAVDHCEHSRVFMLAGSDCASVDLIVDRHNPANDIYSVCYQSIDTGEIATITYGTFQRRSYTAMINTICRWFRQGKLPPGTEVYNVKGGYSYVI